MEIMKHMQRLCAVTIKFEMIQGYLLKAWLCSSLLVDLCSQHMQMTSRWLFVYYARILLEFNTMASASA